MTPETFERIAEFIRTSDLPRKDQKLDGLRRAYIKRHRLDLVGDMLLLDGIAIDPSELENGYWL
ncbi:MAG: hypothetical protein KF777_23320 [Planctomycetaceae bacterium]|nr:hypothetical protein [Planctomycetaceae bacterium]